MTEININENLAVIAEEKSAVETRRLAILAEIGEIALPELRCRPELFDLASEADGTAERIEELNRQEAFLLEEKERHEQA